MEIIEKTDPDMVSHNMNSSILSLNPSPSIRVEVHKRKSLRSKCLTIKPSMAVNGNVIFYSFFKKQPDTRPFIREVENTVYKKPRESSNIYGYPPGGFL